MSEFRMTCAGKILGATLAVAALFGSGYVAGQSRFGQPKTVLHVVELKWNPGVSETDQQMAIAGIKQMAAKLPGVKNIWLKADRVQPRDFSTAFAIEFRDRAAADAYAESEVHKQWEQEYVPLRQESISIQVTNP
ncbi:MAG TPA: Dabb family protein [Verrucomicrobiae bacterium]|nr:Dabb family protein [Verrucomicrobiae bacterium]